jgi:hypothetical protein
MSAARFRSELAEMHRSIDTLRALLAAGPADRADPTGPMLAEGTDG